MKHLGDISKINGAEITVTDGTNYYATLQAAVEAIVEKIAAIEGVRRVRVIQ